MTGWSTEEKIDLKVFEKEFEKEPLFKKVCLNSERM